MPTSERPEPGTTDPAATSPPIEPRATDPAPTSPPTGGATAPPGSDLAEVRAAVADLAERLGVGVDTIDVVEVREVNWPDGSLGCPQPGMSYIQQILNGQLVVLAAGGVRYEYHSGPRRPLFYCPNPTPPADMGFGTPGPGGS